MRDAGSETIIEMDAGIWNDEGRDSLEVAPFLISHRSSSIPHPFRIPHPDFPASCIPAPHSALGRNSGFRIHLASHLSSGLRRFPDTNALDRTIHRSGSAAALEIPIRGVTATSSSRTGSPSRIRSGDEISDAP
jgi:hypothetical protein